MKPSLLFPFVLCFLLAGVNVLQRADWQVVSSPSQPEFLCPAITVSCPESIMYGSPAKFTAKISGAGPSPSLTLSWFVPDGRIISGQKQTHISTINSTTDIVVNNKGFPEESSVTAEVEVGGLDRSCANKASCTSEVIHWLSQWPLDMYGDIDVEDEHKRLDAYALLLREDPTMRGYIVCYGGRRGQRGEAMARCGNAKEYLVGRRGFNPDRIILIDGGFMEQLTVTLWRYPLDVKPPIKPTVNPSEVQFIEDSRKSKGPAARKRRQRE
jgi:hypothetical protein